MPQDNRSVLFVLNNGYELRYYWSAKTLAAGLLGWAGPNASVAVYRQDQDEDVAADAAAIVARALEIYRFTMDGDKAHYKEGKKVISDLIEKAFLS